MQDLTTGIFGSYGGGGATCQRLHAGMVDRAVSYMSKAPVIFASFGDGCAICQRFQGW